MKTNCNTGSQSTTEQKLARPNLSSDTSANDFIRNPSTSGNTYLDGRGYGEYRTKLAGIDARAEDQGELTIAEKSHHKLYERLQDADGELPREKAGDVVMQHLPRADNFNVQGHVAAGIAHRIIRNDPNLAVYDGRLYMNDLDLQLPEDIRTIRLPKSHPQSSTFSTTAKHIVDKEGTTLEGLVHNKLDNTYATQTSRMMAKEPYYTPFDPEDASEYMAQQNKILQEADAWSDVLDEAGLVKKNKLDESTVTAQAKTREENETKVKEVFTQLPKDQNFYFQVFHDWRGRYYFKTRFFNPQGTSFEKASVALVWDGQPAFKPGSTLHNEFAIHMANLAGKDKGSYANYNERIKWYNDTIHSYEDILDNFDESDWPEAMTHYEMSTNGQAGNIPIARDSTTSGYQLTASLMGDQEGLGSLTNINGEMNKRDLYTTAAQEVIDRLSLKDEAGSLRKVFKKPTMMVIYNSEGTSIAKTIEQEYISLKAKKQFEDIPTASELNEWSNTSGVKDEATNVAGTFLDVMGMGTGKADPRFATATEFKEILEGAYQSSDTSEVTWTFPDGQAITYHPIEKDAYKELAEKGKSKNLFGSDQSSKIDGDTYTYKPKTFKRIDKGKDVPRGLMANFVQSVDAYLANYVTAEMIKSGYPILVVHDSYATTAAGVQKMQQLYLEGISTLTTRDDQGQTFFEKAVQDISGGKNSYTAKDMDADRLQTSIYALS